jgi:hypothetical protein
MEPAIVVPGALVLAGTLCIAGDVACKYLDDGTRLWRRVLKIVLSVGLTVLFTCSGRVVWTALWVGALPAVGLVYHVWFCRRPQFPMLTSEPGEKYYRLHGWPTPPSPVR